MTTDEIVRRFAAKAPLSVHTCCGEDFDQCAFCDSCSDDAAGHFDSCLWRLAVEWVAANPRRCRVPLTNSFDPQYRECGNPLPCAVHPGSAAL